jgi:SPP1 gp7 family putative phage head morphogenesis protein
MAKTVNEIIKDEIIGHSVNLNRLELQMKKDVLKELKALEKDLIKQLEKSNILNGKPMTKFRQKRLATLLKQIQETVKTAYKSVNNTLTGDLSKVAGIAEAQTIDAVNKSVKIELLSTGLSKQALKSIVSNSLIEGAPSKDWWSRRSIAFKDRFSDTVRQGMLAGETTPNIVRALRGTKALRYKDSVLNGNYRSAEALVRTSIQSVANQARIDTYKDNDDIIKGIEWSATFDNRTSDTCMFLDGLQWDLNYNPLGHGTSFPGATAHWNCRSTTIGITKSWKELGAKGKFKEIPESSRAPMDGQVSGKKNYEAWLKDKPEAFQKEVLGKGKYKLWQKGKLGFKDMVSGSGNPLTLNQIETKLKIK